MDFAPLQSNSEFLKNKIGFLFTPVIYVFLISCFLSCSKNISPVISLHFDGDPIAKEGFKPKEPYTVQYLSYRTRKALMLLPENTLTYDINHLDFKSGTLEFWLKLDSLPSNSPVRLMQVFAKGTHFEVVVNRRTIQFLYWENPGDVAQLLSPEQLMPTKGVWSLWTFCWDSSKNFESVPEIYCNGSPLRTSPAGQSRSAQTIPMGSKLVIGDGAIKSGTDQYAFNLRDLTIWSDVRSPNEIHQSYVSQVDEMKKPLRWRAMDLRHYAGTKVKDLDSTDGFAWTTDPEIAKADGIIIPATGKYQLTFRIKPLTHIPAKSLFCKVWSAGNNSKNSPLVSWENGAKELNRLNEYEDISVPFLASKNDNVGFEFQSWIPSKYSLLLDTVTVHAINRNWKLQRRFEDLQHTMGVWMADPEASNGKAWTNANTLHYGPYICIGQPGKYRATWRIKISQDAPSNVPLLLLDVFAHDGFYSNRRGHKPYAKLALSAAEFQKRDHWEMKSIEFNYDGANMMEFRAFAKLMKPGVVRLDTITVENF